MKETNCDEILMALMALTDGEEAGLGLEEMEAHTANCANCQSEVQSAGAIAGMLQNYARAEETSDLWPAIADRIGSAGRPAAWSNWPMFAGLALILAAYKLIEMLPAEDPGLLLKIAPLLAAAALFIALRENPFKINTELIPER